jgi:Holliday junction DNA helicase RuvB
MNMSAEYKKLMSIVARYPDGRAYLKSVYDRWMTYISKLKCPVCGSTKIKIREDFTTECENGHIERMLGLESWEYGVPPWFMRVLNDHGLVTVLYKSNRATTYGIPRKTLEAIERVFGEIVEEEILEEEEEEIERFPEPTEEMFKDIVGLEKVKKTIIKVLKATKPVHLLIVGPSASSKSMILEIISRYYEVPIILAGTSTRAGLRDFIAENKPRLMIIDELDKIQNPLDLSVLLTWMESQKLTVTMATKRMYIRCPSVCKVIAAANRIDRIPQELLSRFTIVKIRQYTEEETKEICINILMNREGLEKDLAEAIAEAVVKELGSRDPRDCVKIGRLVEKKEDIKEVIEALKS